MRQIAITDKIKSKEDTLHKSGVHVQLTELDPIYKEIILKQNDKSKLTEREIYTSMIYETVDSIDFVDTVVYDNDRIPLTCKSVVVNNSSSNDPKNDSKEEIKPHSNTQTNNLSEIIQSNFTTDVGLKEVIGCDEDDLKNKTFSKKNDKNFLDKNRTPSTLSRIDGYFENLGEPVSDEIIRSAKDGDVVRPPASKSLIIDLFNGVDVSGDNEVNDYQGLATVNIKKCSDTDKTACIVKLLASEEIQNDEYINIKDNSSKDSGVDNLEVESVENEINLVNSEEAVNDNQLLSTISKDATLATDTSVVISGQKRSIEENETDARQALKKVRIFDNGIKGKSLQDSKLKAADNIAYLVEINKINKCLKDEKSKDTEVLKTSNPSAKLIYPSIDNEPIERLATTEMEKRRTNPKAENQKLHRISRKDLENIVVQLFADKLLYEHELGHQRDLCKRLQATLEANRKKAAQFHKEIDDLQKVTQRLQSEYSARKGQIVTPVKVKRSVGIHVTPIIISKGANTSESVSNNVKYISPSKHRKVENLQKNGQKNKSPLTLTDVLSQSRPKSQAVTPTAVANKINSVKVPVSQPETTTNSITCQSSVKSGFIDLTEDEEVSKSLLKPTFSNGTNMVAIPRQAINLASSGQFVALPQSSVNSLLLVPPSAATLVVTSMANNLQSLGGVSNHIRAPIISSAIGINVSQGAISMPSTNTPRLIFTSTIAATPTIAPQVSQLRHPAALPKAPPQQTAGFSKKLPPQPILNLSHKDNTGIVLLWKMAKTDEHEAIASYQLYAYQEGSAPPLPSLWKKVGSVKALELPMACTLTQFMSGHTYHFAVRAVDIRNRLGPFSDPKSIRLKK